MPVLLGLAVAITFGCGDFLGGLSARRSSTAAVVVVSYLWSMVILGGLLLVAHDPGPRAHDLWLGVAAGVIGPIGVMLLYRGLAIGRMSVVAPITAIGASIVPVAWGLLRGERPSALAMAGVVVALVAVTLIAGAESEHDPSGPAPASLRQVLPIAAGSGLAFGVVFILLGSASSEAGVWPLLTARPLAIAVVATGALVTGNTIRPARADRWTIAGAGVADITANALFLVASRTGLLSIVAVVSSLYPASTVALARVVLHERLQRPQMVGLLLAACGVLAMAAG